MSHDGTLVSGEGGTVSDVSSRRLKSATPRLPLWYLIPLRGGAGVFRNAPAKKGDPEGQKILLIVSDMYHIKRDIDAG
jgi:hypothetical protein